MPVLQTMAGAVVMFGAISAIGLLRHPIYKGMLLLLPILAATKISVCAVAVVSLSCCFLIVSESSTLHRLAAFDWIDGGTRMEEVRQIASKVGYTIDFFLFALFVASVSNVHASRAGFGVCFPPPSTSFQSPSQPGCKTRV